MAQLKSTKVFGDLNVTGEVNVSTKITVNGNEVWDVGNLLNIGTTAATARAALGLGAGATRWPTFAEVTGKPATYAPSGHTHTWTQVTGQPATATRWPTFAEVTGKPATYAPSGHTHPWSQVTGQPATATRWPTFAEVTGKPATYAPSSHTHPHTQVTGLSDAASTTVFNIRNLSNRVTPTSNPYTTYRDTVFGGNTDSIKVMRMDATQGVFTAYAPTLTWSTSDTHAYMTVNYSNARINIGAGAGVGIQWDADLYHTANLLNIGTTAATARTALALNTNNAVTFASVTATGNITAYSDIKLKENIEVIPEALRKVTEISGYTYARKDLENKDRQTGVIAQEVQKVLPEAVNEDEDGTLSVAYGNMVGLLVEAIKELKGEVDELKEKLDGITK